MFMFMFMVWYGYTAFADSCTRTLQEEEERKRKRKYTEKREVKSCMVMFALELLLYSFLTYRQRRWRRRIVQYYIVIREVHSLYYSGTSTNTR